MKTYAQRAQEANNPLSKRLLQIMHEKNTNLCVTPDVTKSSTFLEIARAVAPHVAVLKTHVDILTDWSPAVSQELAAMAKEETFLIFEDRKFADIGAVVKMQYEEGLYQVSSWADLVTVNLMPGPGIVEGLKEVGLPLGRGALLLAEMSSKGAVNLTSQAIQIAKTHPDFVVGFITRRKLSEDPGHIHFSPGVKLAEGKDDLGQQYLTPRTVITEGQSDVIIVGRAIIHSPDPTASAEQYREAGIKAYEALLASAQSSVLCGEAG